MKKTLSIVLALALAVAMFAAVALIPDGAGKVDPYKLVAIKVTDAAGYSNPYAAADNANAFVENQAAYVVVEYNYFGTDPDVYKAAATAADAYVTTITSSTLDLSYATSTVKAQVKPSDGTIWPAFTGFNEATTAIADPDTFFTAFDYSSTKAELTLKATVDPAWQPAKDKVAKYYLAFIGVTKPATAGEVKAALKVSSTAFATLSTLADNLWGTAPAGLSAANKVLVVYDAAGVAKYTIYKYGDSFRVFSGKAVSKTWAEDSFKYLFDFVQTGTTFNWVGYAATPSDVATGAPGATTPVGFTYDGKLIYNGADGTLGTADDKDLTAAVNDCNAFFGFSFATSNAAVEKSFTDKTPGNPVIVTDTYAYVTATVETGDDVDIAPTGDFSANIVIVMAASAVLAAAALAFVAKKARD